MKNLNKRIILVSAAAGGKDFLRDAFIAKGYTPDISVTTRPMRDGEEDGKTYHYTNEYIFLELESFGAFYESVCFNNWRYATVKKSWDKSDIFIMTPSGIAHISEEDRKSCYIIFLDIPEEVRAERLLDRSDSDTMERRIVADREDFKDFKDYDMYVSDPLFDTDTLISFVEQILLDEV